MIGLKGTVGIPAFTSGGEDCQSGAYSNCRMVASHKCANSSRRRQFGGDGKVVASSAMKAVLGHLEEVKRS